MFRRCSRCRQELPEEAFNRARDGRQNWCRECFRAYFRERGALHYAQVAAAKTARQNALLAWVFEYFRRHPCTDCGESDIRVLEFDHVRGKTVEVSLLLAHASPLARVQEEVALCEVVCANCHRRRTALRAGWRRIGGGGAGARLRPRQRRNIEWVYDLLRRESCVDCGLADPAVLEFDHVAGKRAGVTQLAWGEYSIATLEAEVAKCEIRCCNCHRRRTAAIGRWRRAA